MLDEHTQCVPLNWKRRCSDPEQRVTHQPWVSCIIAERPPPPDWSDCKHLSKYLICGAHYHRWGCPPQPSLFFKWDRVQGTTRLPTWIIGFLFIITRLPVNMVRKVNGTLRDHLNLHLLPLASRTLEALLMNKAHDRCCDSTRELTYDLLYQQQDPASFLQVPFCSSSQNTPTFQTLHICY